MKTLNLRFEDKEFKKVLSKKDIVNKRRKEDGLKKLSWEKFLMILSESVK